MTKAQLIKLLAPFPDHMEVVLDKRKADYFGFPPVEAAIKKIIGYSEYPGGKVLCKESVIILSNEL